MTPPGASYSSAPAGAGSVAQVCPLTVIVRDGALVSITHIQSGCKGVIVDTSAVVPVPAP